MGMKLTRENNFDFIRLFAAFCVLVSHSYPLYGLKYEGLARLTNIDTLGGFAVTTFFILSGFLITASYDRNPNLKDYFTNRILRIIPGLAAVTLFAMFVLGPIVTTLSMGEYFNHPQTWRYLKNILMFPLDSRLPGVFADLPYPNTVNGAPWTLPLEFTMYLAVAVLGVSRMLNRKMLPIILALLLAVHFRIMYTHRADIVLFYMQLRYLVKFGVAFFAGAVVYVYREHIPVSHTWFAASVIALVGCAATPFAPFGFVFFLPYVILYLAMVKLPYIANVGKYGDFSYGFYIYAFPIQQTYLHFFGHRYGGVGLLVGSSIVTFVFAVMSWHFVEKPALRFKRHPLRKIIER